MTNITRKMGILKISSIAVATSIGIFALSSMTVANSNGLSFDQKITILYQALAAEKNAGEAKTVETECALMAFEKIRKGLRNVWNPPTKKHVRSFVKYLKKINDEQKLKTLVYEYYKQFRKVGDPPEPMKPRLNKRDAKFFGKYDEEDPEGVNPVFHRFRASSSGFMDRANQAGPCYFG